MKQSLLEEKYTTFLLEIDKAETSFRSVDEIIRHLRNRIESEEFPRFIAVFDHYAHTLSLIDGQIGSSIVDAKCVLFCFGLSIQEPCALALRPRSVGIAELKDGFAISFLESPMPLANVFLEDWAKSLCRTEPIGGKVSVMCERPV